jgi:hypothetical protein
LKTHHLTTGDYAGIHALAFDDLQSVCELWNARGEPSGAIKELAGPHAPERTIKHFKIIAGRAVGTLSAPFRWADLGGPGGGSDLISVVEYLADVPREVAARFLKSHLDRSAAARRPSRNEPEAWAPIQAPTARNGAAR